jgi:hypothetical protein
MADSLAYTAQLCMDAFYQEFRPANAFLRLKHFKMLVIAADAKLKKKEYDDLVNLNIRQRRINAPVVLTADNYIKVTADIKDEFAPLPFPIMSFNGPGQNLSVANIELEGGCRDVMPLTQDTKHQAKDIKDVVFWLPACEGIEFLHLKSNCNAKKVNVTYIPVLNEKGSIQEARKWDIMSMVTGFIKSAKDGVIVDMSNDGNPNVASQTEINKFLLKALQK